MFLLTTLTSISITSAQGAADEIAGIWRTEGYAWVFDISSTSVNAYQVTATTCIAVIQSEDITYASDSVVVHQAQFPGLAALLDDPSDVNLTLDNDRLVFDDGAIVPLYATRIDALPASCADGSDETNDPEVNFGAYWKIFAENYAFFDLYGVDWQTVYDTYRPQVTADTTDEELFDILQSTLSESGITDAHVNIIASPTMVFSAGQYADWTQDQDDEVIASYASLIAEKYLIDEPKMLANDQIIYRHLSPTVGYINLLSMYQFSPDGDDLAALADVMPVIQADLADTDTIVIDVRFNPGGSDANAVYIAGYFTDESTLAFSKQAWEGTKFLDLHDVTIEPVDNPHFAQPKVYLLTSNFTTSAGEVFTMTMTALPQVTTVGETTQGAFSDILPVFLPNGWFATLSNERYVSHDGQVYESLGIPPAVEAPMSYEALQAGSDPVLDYILSQINED
jgi:hypothetical protein